MANDFVTSFELTVSVDTYNKIKNLAEDYGWEEELPIRRNVFVPVAMFEGIIEDNKFDTGDNYRMRNLEVHTIEEDGKQVLHVHGEDDSIQRLSERIVRNATENKVILPRPIMAIVLSEDYKSDDLVDMSRDLVRYLDNMVILGEFTTRYDTYENMVNIMNGING